MMMDLSHKKKVLLSAAVLFALASGEAFASSYQWRNIGRDFVHMETLD